MHRYLIFIFIWDLKHTSFIVVMLPLELIVKVKMFFSALISKIFIYHTNMFAKPFSSLSFFLFLKQKNGSTIGPLWLHMRALLNLITMSDEHGSMGPILTEYPHYALYEGEGEKKREFIFSFKCQPKSLTPPSHSPSFFLFSLPLPLYLHLLPPSQRELHVPRQTQDCYIIPRFWLGYITRDRFETLTKVMISLYQAS